MNGPWVAYLVGGIFSLTGLFFIINAPMFRFARKTVYGRVTELIYDGKRKTGKTEQDHYHSIIEYVFNGVAYTYEDKTDVRTDPNGTGDIVRLKVSAKNPGAPVISSVGRNVIGFFVLAIGLFAIAAPLLEAEGGVLSLGAGVIVVMAVLLLFWKMRRKKIKAVVTSFETKKQGAVFLPVVEYDMYGFGMKEVLDKEVTNTYLQDKEIDVFINAAPPFRLASYHRAALLFPLLIMSIGAGLIFNGLEKIYGAKFTSDKVNLTNALWIGPLLVIFMVFTGFMGYAFLSSVYAKDENGIKKFNFAALVFGLLLACACVGLFYALVVSVPAGFTNWVER